MKKNQLTKKCDSIRKKPSFRYMNNRGRRDFGIEIKRWCHRLLVVVINVITLRCVLNMSLLLIIAVTEGVVYDMKRRDICFHARE